MEKRINRLEIIVYILSVLVVLNIALSLFFGFTGKVLRLQNSDTSKKEIELPASLKDEAKESMMREFVEYYDKNDLDAIYGMMSEYSLMYTTKADVEKAIGMMKNFFGNIQEFHYSHSKYMGYYEGAQWHNLVYKIRGDSVVADFFISIRSQNDKWELAAFRFSLDKNYSSGK